MKKTVKIFLVAIAFMVAGNQAFAQFGVHAQFLNSSTWTKLNNSDSKDKTALQGFAVGIDYNIPLVKDILSVQPGLYYQHLVKTEDITSIGSLAAHRNYTEGYLGIPVHLKAGVNLLTDVLRIYIFAGPTFEVGIMATDRVSLTGQILSQNIDGDIIQNCYTGKIRSTSSALEETANNYFAVNDGYYGRFDVMLGGGVGVELVNCMDIKVGYDYGLLNKYKGDFAQNMTANRGQLYVGVGVRF